LYYLKGCISQIQKYANPEIQHDIIIADQSDNDVHAEVVALYSKQPGIKVIKLPRIDAGYPIDAGLEIATGDYFCSLDCDCFPVHKNWLYVPIKLIEKYNLSFVGQNSGLEGSYAQKGKFFHLNNFYRVSTTKLAKRISKAVGFMRPENRDKVHFKPQDNSWGKTPCDNGVIAQWYSDKYNMGRKINLEITSYLGITNKMGLFGMVVDDLVFHMVFGFGEEWIADMNDTLGQEYLTMRQQLQEHGITDELLKEWIGKSKIEHRTRIMDGQPISQDINEYIEFLKAQ
jgi:hypothetical protein